MSARAPKRSAGALAQAMLAKAPVPNAAAAATDAVVLPRAGLSSRAAKAEARLAELLEKDEWESKDWDAWKRVFAKLPDDIDMALVERSLVAHLTRFGPSVARGIEARCDDIILQFAENRALEGRHAWPSWLFLDVAMRTGRFAADVRHRELHALLELVGGGGLRTAGEFTREGVANQIAGHPERVEAARAAFACGGGLRSEYLPLLAVDGTADSLDLLLPYFEAALTTGEYFDVIRERIVPLLPQTPVTEAFVAQFAALFEQRIVTSPAIAFVRELGIAHPPHLIAFTVHFRDRDKRTTFKLAVDSSAPSWFRGTRWSAPEVAPDTLAAALPETTHDFVLRTQHGLPRAPIERWVRAQLPQTKSKRPA